MAVVGWVGGGGGGGEIEIEREGGRDLHDSPWLGSPPFINPLARLTAIYKCFGFFFFSN